MQLLLLLLLQGLLLLEVVDVHQLLHLSHHCLQALG
jgi:hypothetical protein